jgi:hypothetical protein
MVLGKTGNWLKLCTGIEIKVQARNLEWQKIKYLWQRLNHCMLQQVS